MVLEASEYVNENTCFAHESLQFLLKVLVRSFPCFTSETLVTPVGEVSSVEGGRGSF